MKIEHTVPDLCSPPKGELVNQRASPTKGFSLELKFYIPTYQTRKEAAKFILMASMNLWE